MVARKTLDRVLHTFQRAQKTIEAYIGIPELPEDSIRRKHIRDANHEWLCNTPYKMQICDPTWRVTVERIIREHARSTLPHVQFDREIHEDVCVSEHAYEIAGLLQVKPTIIPLWRSEALPLTQESGTVSLFSHPHPVAFYHTHPYGFDTPSQTDCKTFVEYAVENGWQNTTFGILLTKKNTVGWYQVVPRERAK